MKSIFPLAICCMLLIFSCKDDPPVNPNEIISEYYFQAVIDGDTVTYQEDVEDYGNIVGDFWGQQVPGGYQYAPFTCIASAEGVANPNPSTLARSGAVAIMSVTQDEPSSLSEYAQLIATGTHDFGVLAKTTSDSALAGGYVSWFDAGGQEWNTNGGDQTNSSLTVTGYETFTDDDRIPNSHRIVTLTFNCTLYDGNGNSKALTGGKARGRIILW